MKKLNVLGAKAIFTLIVLFLSTVFAQTNWQADFYDQAGIIKVREPEAVMTGSLTKNDALQIGFKDIALYKGHACAGTVSGFLLTKMAVEKLFGEEIPEYGSVRIAAMSPNGIADIAAYILGIHPSNLFSDKPDLVIDPSLQPKEEGVLVMIFQRKDTGKTVKAVFNKKRLLKPEEIKKIEPYKMKFMKGKATDAEIKAIGPVIQSIVKRAITNPPEGVYSVKECANYQFE